MPCDQFLDVIYSRMVARLKPNEKKRDYRKEFDNQLMVSRWRVPGIPMLKIKSEAELPANAPAWWHGEEEASASFLNAMGIKL